MSISFASLRHLNLPINIKILVTIWQIVYICTCKTAMSPNSISLNMLILLKLILAWLYKLKGKFAFFQMHLLLSLQYGKNNPSLNVCECSSTSLQLITFACSWGSGYFQVNELYTRKLEALPPAYTQHKHNYISLLMSKITMFQSNILAVGTLISIFHTSLIFNIYLKHLTLKALIITIADDIFCNNFLHFGYKKID